MCLNIVKYEEILVCLHWRHSCK